jgi:pSer/pThr/pTyr-binding forkhead associated (FHA) protein
MTSQPMLDLEPFDGKAMGVSRLHMLVRPMKDGIYAVDQGSTNGTFINGIKLEPGNVIKLRDNDIIALSRLVLILHIVSVPDIEAPASPAATVM